MVLYCCNKTNRTIGNVPPELDKRHFYLLKAMLVGIHKLGETLLGVYRNNKHTPSIQETKSS